MAIQTRTIWSTPWEYITYYYSIETSQKQLMTIVYLLLAHMVSDITMIKLVLPFIESKYKREATRDLY